MADSPDHSVLTWDTARPRLRQDLRFHFQTVEGRPVYVIEDRANRAYHQIGVAEYRFLRLLNGTKPAAKILAESARNNAALTESEIESLFRWAIDNSLLQSARADQADRRLAVAEERIPEGKVKPLMRFFFAKIPLGSPEELLRPFTQYLAWTLSPPALAVVGMSLLYGIYLAASSWRELSEALGGAFLPQNWFWLLIITIGLKAIHELWHGIATQKFGGVVPEWGIQLIVWISPLAYVDATSSWAFPSRRHRVIVAAAGMLVELTMAVAALHYWAHSSPGLGREMALNIVVSASFVTLLFNANPLMRFDGYYILSDLLDLRNLGQRGQQAFNWMARRFLLGATDQPVSATLRRRFGTYLLYGAASWAWRIFITIGLIALAANLFHGIGLFVLAIGTLVFIAGLTHSAILFFSPGEGAGRIPWRSASWRLGGAAALLFAFLFFWRVDPTGATYAVVEHPDKAVLRAEAAGFLDQIFVNDGRAVTKGELLLRLQSREELTKLNSLRAELRLAETRARALYLRNNLAEWQTEQQKVAGLQDKLLVQERIAASLELRSPIDGIVHAPDLQNQIGSFFQPGQAILTILPQGPPGILVSMRQQDLRHLAPVLKPGETALRVRLKGRGPEIRATLQRIETKATQALPHEALASSSGGPLPVRPVAQEEDATADNGLAGSAARSESLTYYDSIRPEARRDNIELLQPRFTLYATTDADHGLREGEWGRAKPVAALREPLGLWIYKAVTDYIERQFRTT